MFGLAGCVSLSEVSEVKLTNELDLENVRHVKQIYLDACTPSVNISRYQSAVKVLMEDFDHSTNILLVNTCGWVDGIGRDL